MPVLAGFLGNLVDDGANARLHSAGARSSELVVHHPAHRARPQTVNGRRGQFHLVGVVLFPLTSLLPLLPYRYLDIRGGLGMLPVVLRHCRHRSEEGPIARIRRQHSVVLEHGQGLVCVLAGVPFGLSIAGVAGERDTSRRHQTTHVGAHGVEMRIKNRHIRSALCNGGFTSGGHACTLAVRNITASGLACSRPADV